MILKPLISSVNCNLQTSSANCKLQTANFFSKLQTANCKLLQQTANCKLLQQTANCKLQTSLSKLQTANCKLLQQTANCKLQTFSANCKLQTANFFSKLQTANFFSGSSKIKAESNPVLRTLSTYLNEDYQIKIMITGYTDNVGKAEFNQKLSENRAIAIKGELVKHGIDPDRIQVQGKGASDPIADNSTADGRKQNRRVMISK